MVLSAEPSTVLYSQFVKRGEPILCDLGAAADIQHNQRVTQHHQPLKEPVVQVLTATHIQVLEIPQVICTEFETSVTGAFHGRH